MQWCRTDLSFNYKEQQAINNAHNGNLSYTPLHNYISEEKKKVLTKETSNVFSKNLHKSSTIPNPLEVEINDYFVIIASYPLAVIR